MKKSNNNDFEYIKNVFDCFVSDLGVRKYVNNKTGEIKLQVVNIKKAKENISNPVFFKNQEEFNDFLDRVTDERDQI